MNEEKIVIIGGVAAGTKTAAKLRRECTNCQIDLFTDEDFISYSACGMPYFLEGLIPTVESLLIRLPRTFEQNGINIHLNQKCTQILPKEKKIIINNKEIINYDKLVIATGSRAIIPPIKNVNLKNVFTLKHIPDVKNIKLAMKAAKTVTIIGGGYIGIELCEAFVKNKIKVNIVEASNTILSIFDEDISLKIQNYIKNYDKNLINIITNDLAVEFQGNEKVEKVITRNGIILDSDFVIIATGVTPNSEIAIEAGLKEGYKKTIWVDEYMKTSDNNIYAAGDCAQKINIVTKKPCWIPLGSTANKEGRIVAINLAGGKEKFEGVLGSVITRFFDYSMSLTGITQKEALLLGYDAISKEITEVDMAGYMPKAKDITIKLIIERKTHRILGAQAIGEGQVHKRINAVSTALIGKMKIEELANLDLAYAPPYSPTIDPLINLARMIADELNGD